jgi:hypothetical protein
MHLFNGSLPDNRKHSIQSDILFEREIKAEMKNGTPAKPKFCLQTKTKVKSS